jgi:hypothetical protein
VLIVIILVGVSVFFLVLFANQRDRGSLTEGEFRDAVHQAAERLGDDPDPVSLHDYSTVISGAVSDAEEAASPDVDAIGDDSWDFEADPPTPPTYSEYEIRDDQVDAVFCMSTPGFTVTEGGC